MSPKRGKMVAARSDFRGEQKAKGPDLLAFSLGTRDASFRRDGRSGKRIERFSILKHQPI
jgi:hypothetical protein